jgi:hypothetical protein
MNTEHETGRLRLKRLAAYALLVVVLVCAPIFIRENRKAAHIEEDLQAELKAIASPLGAAFTRQDSRHKPASAFVGQTYSVKSDLQTIKRFYEGELAKRGWVYNGERMHGTEVVVEFCRGSYGAKIDCPKKDSDPLEYTLYLDWGLNDCS